MIGGTATQNASTYRIGLIAGDGVGKEVIPAARHVLEATGVALDFVELQAGWETFQQTGSALPDETVQALKECDGALFGAVSSPSHRVPGYSSPIIGIRQAFDLYANLRPVVSAPVADSRPDVDMLIVRENSEGLYVKRERLEEGGERAVAERVITRRASRRIGEVAFRRALTRAAEQSRRARVTIVHKANVLSLSDGLFRESVLDVSGEYPEVETEEQLVDSMIYRMIREPQRYDVIVAPNLYGDILSDAAAALVGGLGLVSSANIGDNFVVAEPVHGSAPDIAGQGIVNPIATIRAAAQLMAAIGEMKAVMAIEEALSVVLRQGPFTPDLGGSASTIAVTLAVIGALKL